MLERGETVGVFQLESAGMRKAVTDMRADRFEILLRLWPSTGRVRWRIFRSIALGRMVKNLSSMRFPSLNPSCARRSGDHVSGAGPADRPRPCRLQPCQADLLRRAMGKKIKAEMDAQRERFVSGAVERKIAKPTADAILMLARNSLNTGSISPTQLPTRCFPIKPPGSKPIIRSNFSPRP